MPDFSVVLVLFFLFFLYPPPRPAYFSFVPILSSFSTFSASELNSP